MIKVLCITMIKTIKAEIKSATIAARSFEYGVPSNILRFYYYAVSTKPVSIFGKQFVQKKLSF